MNYNISVINSDVCILDLECSKSYFIISEVNSKTSLI